MIYESLLNIEAQTVNVKTNLYVYVSNCSVDISTEMFRKLSKILSCEVLCPSIRANASSCECNSDLLRALADLQGIAQHLAPG